MGGSNYFAVPGLISGCEYTGLSEKMNLAVGVYRVVQKNGDVKSF